jgi:uncharacterized protein
MLFIDVRELERDKLEFSERLPPRSLDLGKDVLQAADLETVGSAELVERDIRLQGNLQTVVEVLCARCLEPIKVPVKLDFDLFYRPVETIAQEGEEEVAGDELEVGFYHGNGLMLEDALKEQILLGLPMKHLCRPDCKGLCPQCGHNRNVKLCACPPLSADDRWAPLAGFKNS